MTFKRFILLFVLSVFALIETKAQSADEVFTQANQAYNDGEYQEAIRLYESIVEMKLHSAELYFNLANAYYKSNQVAPSIYYYEKALLLDPKDEDIKKNLSFAQNMTIDSIEEIPEVGISRMINNATSMFSFEGWARTTVLFMLIFVALFLYYYFAVSTNRKRIMFLGSFIALGISLLSLSIAFRSYDRAKKDNPAIIFAEKSEVHADPNLRSDVVFNLHEGTKVQVLESFNGNWTKIRLSDGKTGWIASDDIKLLDFFNFF